jgi:hypothetical protein
MFSARHKSQPAVPQPEHASRGVSVDSTKPNGQLPLYFNTTSLTGDDLTERRKRAAAQEDAVLALYRKHGQLGPWQAWELAGQQWPITSVRRAINTLTKRGALVKLPSYRMGPEGSKEHLWSRAA